MVTFLDQAKKFTGGQAIPTLTNDQVFTWFPDQVRDDDIQKNPRIFFSTVSYTPQLPHHMIYTLEVVSMYSL